jgi:hypothetical protein
LLTLDNWQGKEKSRAFAHFGLHPDFSTVSPYQDAAYSQSEANTLDASMDSGSQTFEALEKLGLFIMR